MVLLFGKKTTISFEVIRRLSPDKVGEKVTVVGMASEDESERDLFVEIEWEGDEFSVLLSQLTASEADEATQEAIEDWHYWIGQG